ncbi:hypothetical protein Tco_0711421 [Tanacetum coccineum]
MTTLKFADTHNMVAFLAKPAESEGFEQIATIKAKTVNGEVQLQALVDKKKIIITESIVRRDLQLEDTEGVDCLPNATIFEYLTLMGYEKLSQKLTFYKAFFSQQWKFLIHTILQCLSAKTTAWNEFSRTMASAIICLATNQKFNFSKYIFGSMVKNLENMSDQEEVGEGSEMPTDPQHTPIIIQPSTYQPQKKQRSRRSKKKDTEVPQPSGPTTNIADEAINEEMDDNLERAATTASSLEHSRTVTRSENVSKLSNDPLLAKGNTLRSGDDSMKVKELMEFCTKLQQRVLDLENTKTAQAQEITSLKLRVKKLEKKGGSRNHKLKRLYKVGRSAKVISSDEASLGDQEDASKQERKIDDIDKDAKITLVDETQGSTAGVATTVSAAAITVPITPKEITLAQALEELKTAKPNVKGIVFKEPVESTTTTTISSQQPSQANVQDKGKGKMVEPEKPTKRKNQIRHDEEVAQRLQAQLQAELEEEDRLVRQRKEESNIVSWDNVQAMIDADYQMA